MMRNRVRRESEVMFSTAYSWLAHAAVLPTEISAGRHRHHRRRLCRRALGEREYHHQESQHDLRLPVVVVDPEPLVAVLNRHVSVFGRRLAIAHGEQRRKQALLLGGALWAVDTSFGDVGHRHVDVGGEVDHDLEYRPRQDGDLRIPIGKGSVCNVEFALRGVEAEQLANPAAGRRLLLWQGTDEHYDVLLVLRAPDPESRVTRGLGFAHGGHEFAKFLTAFAGIAGSAVGVIETVDRIHGSSQHEVGRITDLDQKQESRHRERGHHAPRELVTGERLIGDGRPVRVAPGGAHAAEGVATVHGSVLALQADLALYRVGADHRRDVHEYRRIGVTHLQ